MACEIGFEFIVDRVRLLHGAETALHVGTELFMLGNRNAPALRVVALIVADQPFDGQGFASHLTAPAAAASVDEKMRSISEAGIMAAPNPVTALRRPFETWR
jgi:hypothetical protein